MAHAGKAGADPAEGREKETWVQCDRCQKWRRMPVEIVEALTDDDKWFCRMNPDSRFNRCKVPQEMSDAEINRQLGIDSDQEGGQQESGDDAGEDAAEEASSSESEEVETPPTGSEGDRKPAVWQLTRQNLYVMRKRKVWKDEEVMVCQCWPPPPGKRGCLEECLNRLVKVECAPKHCPCGDACANQQFQRRAYRQLEVMRCGSKGFGLRALEDIPKQTFFIEYTGEVLDEATFEGRLKQYARAGQRHMYFMTIGNGEYIDACQKGNLGRFINHSCNPNAEVQKWQVRGELCVGLFTLRDVAAGEELTFDYNYDKSRKDAKPCLCGEPQCRGWIGGDLESPAAKRVQARLERARERGPAGSAEEEEEPEPIMLPEDAGAGGEDGEGEGEESPADMATVLEGNKRFQKKQAQLLQVALHYRSGGGGGQAALEDAERKLAKKRKKGSEGEGPPPRSKKVKTGGGRAGKGGRGAAGKGAGAARSEVERELAGLLDEEGGLERRKGAAQEFITLLAQAEVAGGEGKGGRTLCSTRDLMALLEALLRTHSRSVLKDFVATNGLEVVKSLLLHLREDPDKPPVLRKLVRALEFLADQGLLQAEHLLQAHPPGAHAASPPPTLHDALALLERHSDRELQARVRQFRLKVPPATHAPAAPGLPAARRPLSPALPFPGPSYSRGSDPELARLGGRLPQEAPPGRSDARAYGAGPADHWGHTGPGDALRYNSPAGGSGHGDRGVSSGALPHARDAPRGPSRPGSPPAPLRHPAQQGGARGPQSRSPEHEASRDGRERYKERSEGRARPAELPRGEERRGEDGPRQGRGHERRFRERSRSPARRSWSPPLRREHSPRRERRRTGFSDHAGDPWAEEHGNGARQREPGPSSQKAGQAAAPNGLPKRDAIEGAPPVAAGPQQGGRGDAPEQAPAEVGAAPLSPRSLDAEGRRKVALWQQRMLATIQAGEGKAHASAAPSPGPPAPPADSGSTPPPWGPRGAPPAPTSSHQPGQPRAPWEGHAARPGPPAGFPMTPAPWHTPAPPGTAAPWARPAERSPFSPGLLPVQPPPLPPDGPAPPPPPGELQPPPPPPSYPGAAQPPYPGGPPPPPLPGQLAPPPPPLPPQPMRLSESGFLPPPPLPPYPPLPPQPAFPPAPPPMHPPPLPSGPTPAAMQRPTAPAPGALPGLANGGQAHAASPMPAPHAGAGEARRGGPGAEDSSSRDWISDEPTSSDFQHLVMEIVRYRMAAYKFKIQKNKAEEICSKLTGKIISGEKKAYQEREKQGQGKGPRPLQKSVLANKVKKFVVDYMEQYLAKAANGGT